MMACWQLPNNQVRQVNSLLPLKIMHSVSTDTNLQWHQLIIRDHTDELIGLDRSGDFNTAWLGADKSYTAQAGHCVGQLIACLITQHRLSTVWMCLMSCLITRHRLVTVWRCLMACLITQHRMATVWRSFLITAGHNRLTTWHTIWHRLATVWGRFLHTTRHNRYIIWCGKQPNDFCTIWHIVEHRLNEMSIVQLRWGWQNAVWRDPRLLLNIKHNIHTPINWWQPFLPLIAMLLHKSHNTPNPYPTMHHFVTNMMENGALWVICLMHCGICEMDELFIILLFSDF